MNDARREYVTIVESKNAGRTPGQRIDGEPKVVLARDEDTAARTRTRDAPYRNRRHPTRRHLQRLHHGTARNAADDATQSQAAKARRTQRPRVDHTSELGPRN